MSPTAKPLGGGMACPRCNRGTFVVDSRYRTKDGIVRRRRQCNECGRFSTVEMTVERLAERLSAGQGDVDRARLLASLLRDMLGEDAA